MAVSGVKEIKFGWYVGNYSDMGEGHVTLDRCSEKTQSDEKEWARSVLGE